MSAVGSVVAPEYVIAPIGIAKFRPVWGAVILAGIIWALIIDAAIMLATEMISEPATELTIEMVSGHIATGLHAARPDKQHRQNKRGGEDNFTQLH